MGTASHTVNEDASVYYDDGYWNQLSEVIGWMSTKMSGREDHFWIQHLKHESNRVFKRALVLNCGDGNAERSLLEHGICEEAVGIDYSDELLDRARASARDAGLPLRYVQMDTNTAAFPDEEFDLVLNQAAGHHIAYIDRVYRAICDLLPEDGVFAQWDYVGPHRNQYPYEQWDALYRLNQRLPEHARNPDIGYPHLPTMLATDPTEAIHSELIVETTYRYFDVREHVKIGGALAYPLLFHHPTIYGMPDDERRPLVEQILEADDEFLEAHPDLCLFAWIVARPDKSVLAQEDELAGWTAAEDDRERRAEANGGEYYDLTALQQVYQELADAQTAAAHARLEAAGLRKRFPNAQVENLVNSAIVKNLRTQPSVSKLERRVRGLDES